jgi:glycosyltransferase involved in cell wall biosynthesis
VKVIALHHRLSTFGNHRYNEGLGLIDESRRRGWELDLLVSIYVKEPVLQALGSDARPVFRDPTFEFTRSFDERVDDFVQQLARHAQPALTSDCRVLLTVATQCEVAALARWAASIPGDRMPWFLVLFLSDRWNRQGARPEEPVEIETAARALAQLAPPIQQRFVLSAATPGLARELSRRLRQPVSPTPAHLNYQGLDAIASARALRPLPARPALGFLGGARPEKGFGRVADIVAACRTRTNARFVIQAYDEGLEPAKLQRLHALGADPDVLMFDHPLDRQTHSGVLAQVDAVVCPYERLNYKQRNSAIFSEAIAAGLPGVVPSGTWLAEQIEFGRAAGVVYTADDAGGIADAIARCVADLDALTRAAANCAGPWRDSQSLGAWLDAMELLRSARESTGSANGNRTRLSALKGRRPNR